MKFHVFTLNICPNTARLMQRMELEMLVPEMRLSGSKTRKPFSLSINQDPPSHWPSRWTTSPVQTGVISLYIYTGGCFQWQNSISVTDVTIKCMSIFQQQYPSIFSFTIRLSADTSQLNAKFWNMRQSVFWGQVSPPHPKPSSDYSDLQKGRHGQEPSYRNTEEQICFLQSSVLFHEQDTNISAPFRYIGNIIKDTNNSKVTWIKKKIPPLKFSPRLFGFFLCDKTFIFHLLLKPALIQSLVNRTCWCHSCSWIMINSL